MNSTKPVLPGLLGICIVAAVTCILWWRHIPGTAGAGAQAPVAAPAPKAAASPPPEIFPVRRGDTFDAVLTRSGIGTDSRSAILTAINATFDARKLRAGSQLTLVRGPLGVEALEYSIDPDRKLHLKRAGDIFQAAVVEVPGSIRSVAVCGSMSDSLFESVERTGESAVLALEMAKIFAWDLDFYTDPQPGDEFCLLVEKKEYHNGQPPAYRRILAATYENSGKVFDAYLFAGDAGKPRYYSRDGRSLQAAFLRSPMKFEARVSSRFSHRRFHPILKTYRPHLGTDYAAPAGSTVQAIAAGRVVFSGRSGGAGNLIKIRHASGFESQYLHLSRRLVRVGQRVEQGQRIGTVGATGLATGPHLDFRLRKNGRYVDFERLRPPRLTVIDAARMPAFAARRDEYAALLQTGREPESPVLASSRLVSASGID
jgi:murein DD-endopeptidase MepM/ murein hydrolase activator NlpD